MKSRKSRMTESKFNPGPAAAAAAPVARPILVFESRPRVALWHGLVCAMRRGPTGPEPKHGPRPGLAAARLPPNSDESVAGPPAAAAAAGGRLPVWGRSRVNGTLKIALIVSVTFWRVPGSYGPVPGPSGPGLTTLNHWSKNVQFWFEYGCMSLNNFFSSPVHILLGP